MQIIGLCIDLPDAGIFDLFYRKVEKVAVVGLKFDVTALFQDLVIAV